MITNLISFGKFQIIIFKSSTQFHVPLCTVHVNRAKMRFNKLTGSVCNLLTHLQWVGKLLGDIYVTCQNSIQVETFKLRLAKSISFVS